MSSPFRDWKYHLFESPCFCRAEICLAKPLASSPSIRRKVWNRCRQRRKGESPNQKGRSIKQGKVSLRGRCSLKCILRVPSTFSLCWECPAPKGLRNELPVHEEPGPRTPWQLKLKLAVPWTSLSCGQQESATMCIHANYVPVSIIIEITVAITVCYILGNACTVSWTLSRIPWAGH